VTADPFPPERAYLLHKRQPAEGVTDRAHLYVVWRVPEGFCWAVNDGTSRYGFRVNGPDTAARLRGWFEAVPGVTRARLGLPAKDPFDPLERRRKSRNKA
jgi:hypothetical protein